MKTTIKSTSMRGREGVGKQNVTRESNYITNESHNDTEGDGRGRS